MTSVGVVGTRRFRDLDACYLLVSRLPHGTTVLVAGDRVVSGWVRSACFMRGLPTVVYLPEYATHGDHAPEFTRRKLVSDLYRDGGRLVVLGDPEDASIAPIVALARARGLHVEVVTHAGTE